MKPSDRIWEVWQGQMLVCSAAMGLTRAEAENKVVNEFRNGVIMEARPAAPVVVSTGGSRLLCTLCGARAEHGHQRFRERHPKLCQERAEFARQLSRGTRSVEE